MDFDSIFRLYAGVKVANEVVGVLEHEDFLFDHAGGLGAQYVHGEGTFDIAEADLDLPAPAIERAEELGRVKVGIAEGGDEVEGDLVSVAVVTRQPKEGSLRGSFEGRFFHSSGRKASFRFWGREASMRDSW